MSAPASRVAAKLTLRITDESSDALIDQLVTSALAEYAQFCDLDSAPAWSELAEDAQNGVLLMVQGDYDADPTKRMQYRDAAEALWWPHRQNLGV